MCKFYICAVVGIIIQKLQYTWCAHYCKCVLPAQLSILTAVSAPSLLEQHPRYVPPPGPRRPRNESCYFHICDFSISPLQMSQRRLYFLFSSHNSYWPHYLQPAYKTKSYPCSNRLSIQHWPITATLKMEAEYSSEMWVSTYMAANVTTQKMAFWEGIIINVTYLHGVMRESQMKTLKVR